MAKKTSPPAAPPTPSATHTPGPWQVLLGDTDTRQMSRIVRAEKASYQPEPMLIAYVLREWSHPGQQAEDDANARLMASAPDLLAFCEAFLACSARDRHDIALETMAEEAIRKVRSEQS